MTDEYSAWQQSEPEPAVPARAVEPPSPPYAGYSVWNPDAAPVTAAAALPTDYSTRQVVPEAGYAVWEQPSAAVIGLVATESIPSGPAGPMGWDPDDHLYVDVSGLIIPLTQNLNFNPTNTYDIGAGGRPRNIYAGTDVIAAGFVRPVGGIRVEGNSLGGGSVGTGQGMEMGYTPGGPGQIQVLNRSVFAWQDLQFQASSLILTPQIGGLVEQRNGTNPQVLRIYNTFTDASNYERLRIEWTGNNLQIGTQNLGTGTGRAMILRSATTLDFGSGGNDYWRVNGSFFPLTDNIADIGVAGSLRPRNVFIAGAVATGVKAGAAIDADVNSPADGMLRVDSTNNRLYVRVGGTWRYAALT